jgi:hypothetical protein
MPKAEQLLEMAIEVATTFGHFQLAKGPGAGNSRTNLFVRALNDRAVAKFGQKHHERQLCEQTDLRADYYFEDEGTIVEIALGLPNPNTEFEKDILKALVARDRGLAVEHLIFISRAGAIAKCNQPGRPAMVEWARRVHDLKITILELGGLARKRLRVVQRDRNASAILGVDRVQDS